MAGHHQKAKCLVFGCSVFRFGLLVYGPLYLKTPFHLPASSCPLILRNFLLGNSCLAGGGGACLPLAWHPSLRYIDLKIWKGGMWSVPQGIEDMWPIGKQTEDVHGEVLAGRPLRAPKGH